MALSVNFFEPDEFFGNNADINSIFRIDNTSCFNSENGELTKFTKMSGQHFYKTIIHWTGNTGTGTDGYKNYERSHDILVDNKTAIQGSSDPAFRGDSTKHNPEELFVSSLSSCHMLWYLHICSEAGVVVVDYVDNAIGIMMETPEGSGHFTEVVLNPVVTVAEESMIEKANELHKRANEFCFIANSVKFPVKHKPQARVL